MKTIYPDFDRNQLIPVVIQDYMSLKVLMMAYMNKESYEKTLAEGDVTFYSRSRKKLWKKGESSGHIQKVRKILFDCDEDCLLILVEQIGGASCHEGYVSCFFRELKNNELKVVENRVFNPDEVYG